MTQETTEEVQDETAEHVEEQTELCEPPNMWEIVQKRAKKNWYIIS